MQLCLRFLSATIAALFAVAPMSAAAHRTLVTVWPGYTLELPSGYCAQLSKGPDFDVLYVRERGTPEDNVLAGIYAGYAPKFDPDCAKPTTRTWISNRLKLKSVRGPDSCAELLIEDPTNSERGKLHIWFGPAAKHHRQLAEDLVSSVRPAVMPVADATNVPPCN
jgi:hypothetical protein